MMEAQTLNCHNFVVKYVPTVKSEHTTLAPGESITVEHKRE